jgi:steroid 5-alpha reductase family enzyme
MCESGGFVVTPAERASEDAYISRMRPTLGYVMALTWLAQMGAIAWVIVADPVQANLIITAMASLGTIWSVGLGVLGIYVYKRSEDKRISAVRTEVQDGALTSKTGR